MTLSDPAGLLQRMPELERIALEDGPVRSALGSGDPFKLYRALRWGSWTGRLRAHQPQVKELLANRRLFARPLSGSPTLFTLNSLGAGFVGESEHAPDGTYITGHYVVILFKMPLLPLGAYVVGPGDTATSYRIFARVPLGGFTWAWSRAAALACALLIASGAWGAFHDSRYATVTVANGFKKQVDVEVGGQKLTVGAGFAAPLVVPIGEQQARATLEGKVVDEGPINVVSGNDAFVWNVGGVAPVFKVNIDYSATPQSVPPDPHLVFFCGRRLITEPKVDYLFREPDQQVKMGKYETSVTKVMLSADWSRGAERAPCLTWLYLEGDEAGVQSVAASLRKADELSGEEESLPIVTSLLARADDGVWDQARALLQHRSDDLESSRTVLWAAEETGHLEELAAELAARQAKRPDDPDAAYLAQQAVPTAVSLAQWEALLKKFPGHDPTRRAVQSAAVRESEWQRALAIWLDRLDDAPAAACDDADLIAVPAVELHRELMVLEALEGCGDKLGMGTALSAIRLAQAAQQDPQPWLARLGSDLQRERVRVLVGLPTDPKETRLKPMTRFITAVHQSGEAMLAELGHLPPSELQAMDAEVALLVWAEAVRQKHAAAKSFARRSHLHVEDRKALEAFITGGKPELEPKRFSPSVRAIAWLVRSRAPDVSPREKDRLRKLAQEDGVQTGFVASALKWP